MLVVRDVSSNCLPRLIRQPIANMIDDESSDDPRCISHEATAIGKGSALLRGHIKTRLAEEHSRRDAYVALAYELASCQSAQFSIGKSKELLGGSFVAMFRQAHAGSDCYVGVSMTSQHGAQPLAFSSKVKIKGHVLTARCNGQRKTLWRILTLRPANHRIVLKELAI
jgi:hypothetical protein